MSNPPWFTTGDAFSTDSFFWVGIRFPTSQGNWVFGQFLAGLWNMASYDAWVTGGETTPEEAYLIFRDIFNNRIVDMPWSIGDIKFTGAPPDSATWLLCDGSLYEQSDYPDLYARIGTTFNTGGEGPTQFRVPDMRGRVAAMTDNSAGVSPWATAPGATAGEVNHTLVVSEMPSHNHSDSGHVHGGVPILTDLVALTGEEPVSFQVPLVSANTASGSANITNTGGDGAHNNVQPSMALACYILAAY
jgi:microcystin-dependent protein